MILVLRQWINSLRLTCFSSVAFIVETTRVVLVFFKLVLILGNKGGVCSVGVSDRSHTPYLCAQALFTINKIISEKISIHQNKPKMILPVQKMPCFSCIWGYGTRLWKLCRWDKLLQLEYASQRMHIWLQPNSSNTRLLLPLSSPRWLRWKYDLLVMECCYNTRRYRFEIVVFECTVTQGIGFSFLFCPILSWLWLVKPKVTGQCTRNSDWLFFHRPT